MFSNIIKTITNPGTLTFLFFSFMLLNNGLNHYVMGQVPGQVPGTMFASVNSTTDIHSQAAGPSQNPVQSNSMPIVSSSQEKTGDVLYAPKITPTKIYYEGAETLGRVGHQAILKRDILHQLRKRAQEIWIEQLKSIPKETLETMTKEQRDTESEKLRQEILNEFLNNKKIYSEALDSYIKTLLYYNDFVVSRPKEQVDEQKKNLLQVFETECLPKLMEEFGCKTMVELEEYYKKNLHSTLNQEKHLFITGTVGASWMEFNLDAQTSDPSVVDLRRYYEANLDLYRIEERVRWQAICVRFDNHSNRQEAYDKIARMGNYIMNARTLEEQKAFFEEVAKKDSEDMFASKGGNRDWTKRGVLNSKVIEDAIFSKNLPVGELSRILEDESGYIILCVLQREDETWTPFIKVQEEVKKKLIKDRRSALEKQYEEELSKRFTIELYNIGDVERKRRVESFSNETQSASGR